MNFLRQLMDEGGDCCKDRDNIEKVIKMMQQEKLSLFLHKKADQNEKR